MITVTIRQAAKRRGLDNAYQFGQSVGLADMVAARIWKSDQLPKLKTLDKICNAWGCDLGELIVYVSDKNGRSTTSPQKRVKINPTVKKVKAVKLSATKRSR